MTADPNRDIDSHVPVLARVEGEGSLEFTARNGKIEELNFQILQMQEQMNRQTEQMWGAFGLKR